MSKRFLRLAVAGSMLVTLFLRWNPLSDLEGYTNAFFIVWFSLEALSMMMADFTVANILGWSSFILFLQAIPLLIVLNVWLAVRPIKNLRRFYRLVLVILLPITWVETFTVDPGWRGVGFWAHSTMVSIAALAEIIHVIAVSVQKREVAN